MPTYEYECKECGHHFEVFQKMTDAPLESCPECKGSVQRLLGAGGGIILKGSGFYANEYRSAQPSCGREKTCCGRETPCQTKPCDK